MGWYYTDCKLRILDKYQAMGVELVGVYDEEREFFLIKDRICPYARGPAWLAEYEEDVEGQIERELQHNFNVVFFANADTELDDLIAAVEKIQNTSKSKPRVITIIRSKHTKIKPSEIEKRLEPLGIEKWTISNVMIEVPQQKLIDDVVRLAKKHTVYIFVFDNKCIPDGLLDKINEYSIKNLNLFGMIDGGGLVATMRSEYLRVYYMDDASMSVIDKIREEPAQYGAVSLEEVMA